MVFVIDRHFRSSRKIPVRLVSFEDYPLLFGPLNPEGRIIPADATPVFWSVELRHLIEDLCVVFQRLKPMGEALRDVQHPSILC